LAEPIVAAKKLRLGGEIMFDRLLNAGVEERRVRRCVKEAVAIARVIRIRKIEAVSVPSNGTASA
jgi:hypothetical protein